MKKRFLITVAAVAATLSPMAAQAQTRELQRDRQEVREEQRELKQAKRYGDRVMFAKSAAMCVNAGIRNIVKTGAITARQNRKAISGYPLQRAVPLSHLQQWRQPSVRAITRRATG